MRQEETLCLQWDDIQEDRLTVNRALAFLRNNQPAPVKGLKNKIVPPHSANPRRFTPDSADVG